MIDLIDVSKSYGPGLPAVNHANLHIDKGEFVFVVGNSGSGKTTLIKLLMKELDSTSGQIIVSGERLEGMKHRRVAKYRRKLGVVFQDFRLLKDRNVYENVAFAQRVVNRPTRVIRKRVPEVLQEVGLAVKYKSFPDELSGGEQQRVALARALVNRPDILLADEPTGNLDSKTGAEIMKLLREINQGTGQTIIMVTHTIQSIDLCDKVIFMGPGGKICYCGPPSEITNYFGKKSLVEVYNELAGNVDNWNGYFLQNYYMEKQNNPPSRTSNPNEGLEKKGKQVSSFKQCLVLIARYFELIWNDKQRLLLLFIQPIAIAFLLAVVAVDDTFITYEDTRSIMFALSCSGIWIGLFNTIQEVCKERPILKREYMGNLRLWGYIVSKYVVQGVICFLQATLLVAIFLRLMKHSAEAGLYFAKPGMEIWITMILTIFASASMGLIVSSLMKNGDRAMAVAPFVLIIQLLFSGVLFTLDGMAEHVSKITVSRWAMECLGNITNLNKLTSRLSPGGVHEVEDYYVRTTTHLAHTWEVLILVAVLCGIISIVVLRSLKKDHR